MIHANRSVLVFATAARVLSACGSDSTGTGTGETSGGSAGAAGTSIGAQGGTTVTGGGSAAGGASGSGATQSGTGAAASSGTTDAGGAAAGGGGTGGSRSGGSGASGAGGRGPGGSGGTAGGAGTANGGAGAAGGGAGSNGGSSCNVAPVNPNATKQAKNLLCYIYSLYGNHVLSGQQETSWSNPEGDITWYTNNGMKPPAILGGDYLYPSGTSTRAIAYWNAGGITMIRYHMGAPPLADTYPNAESSTNIDNVLKDGTTENTSFKSKLDYVGGELKKLQDANVAVLWAPFHEVQPNGWFWWAKGTGPQFIGLWKYMFNYLTTTKGLNNLVWLLPFSGSPNSAYYPGKDFLDLAGPDIYATNPPYTGLYSSAKNVIGTTIPIPLHETGMIPNPSGMFPSAAPWVLFNVWATYENDGTHNTLSNIKSVYADSHTVTRDLVPNLK